MYGLQKLKIAMTLFWKPLKQVKCTMITAHCC